MAIRILNTALLIAAIIGGVFTYQAGQKHHQLIAEYNRLAVKVGDFQIDDPTKVYIRAIDTGEPLHFAWRVFLPAGFSATWQHIHGGTSRGFSSDSREFIARVRFYENDEGRLLVFIKQGFGGGVRSLGDRRLADLLRGKWEQIQVEQLGSNGIAVIEPDEIAEILKLKLSDELKREAELKLPKYLIKRCQTEFFFLRLGSDKAFEQAQANTIND